MEETAKATQNHPLFAGMERERITLLLRHLAAREEEHRQGKRIFRAGDPAGTIGLLLSGEAQVIREDFTGGRLILTRLGPGDLFGEAFACAGTATLPVSVESLQNGRVLLLNYSGMQKDAGTEALRHRLDANLMRILAAKNVLLSGRIEILSRRTTRKKLIAYLSAESRRQGRASFKIPFRRQELADYLAADRSAMTTELSRMRREGLIDFHGRQFTLRASQEE